MPANLMKVKYDALGELRVTLLLLLAIFGGQASAQNPPPTLSSISPNAGPVGGGTALTLTGTGFQAGLTLTIGGGAAGSINVVSDTAIAAVTPAGVAGSTDVTVTNPDGQVAVLSGGFTYNPAPTISAVVPASGPVVGSTAVTITGTGFLFAATVTVGGTAATNVNVASATSIAATTPHGNAGAADVVVSNADGQSATLAGGFLYQPAPTVISISPTSGPPAGGSILTITGGNFVAGATVTVGGVAATNVAFVNTGTLTATTPSHSSGIADIVVTNPDGQSATLSNGYTYSPSLAIQAISPNNGPLIGGTAVTISGAGFVSGATVSFGGTTATNISVASAASITATTPPGQAGAVNVLVTNPDGQSTTLIGGYAYNSAPTVTAISPNNGAVSGGTPVTITGTGFLSGATGTFGGIAATMVSMSSTSIMATTPPGPTGTSSVVVTNPDGQSATSATLQLLSNPGFEVGSNYWRFGGTGTATIQTNTSNAHTGSNYGELTAASGNHPLLRAAISTGTPQYFPVNPGDLITFGGWVSRVSGNGGANRQTCPAACDGRDDNDCVWPVCSRVRLCTQFRKFPIKSSSVKTCGNGYTRLHSLHADRLYTRSRFNGRIPLTNNVGAAEIGVQCLPSSKSKRKFVLICEK